MSLYEPTYMEGTLGTMAVDWEERINMARMRDERKSRAQHHIAEAGLGSVLLLDDPNIRYVTGLAMLGGSGADHYSFLTAGGDIVHWDTADHATNERANCPWLPDIRYAAPGLGNVPRASGSPSAREFLLNTMADLIVEAAHDYDVHRDPVGIDATQPGLAAKLRERGLDVREGAADALHTARQTKTKDEIECFRVLSAICEAGFMAIKKAAEPGMLEQEVWGAAVGSSPAPGRHGGGWVSHQRPQHLAQASGQHHRSDAPPRRHHVRRLLQRHLPGLPVLRLPDLLHRQAAATFHRRLPARPRLDVRRHRGDPSRRDHRRGGHDVSRPGRRAHGLVRRQAPTGR